MKILHITAAYKPAFIYGGPTMSVAMLCEELAGAGIESRVFTTTANGKTELPVATDTPVNIDGVPVRYFKRLTKDHTHFSPALLNAVWEHARDFDIIHIHAWWNLVSVLACGIALGRKVPVVVSPRGMLSSYTFGSRNMGAKSIIHKLMGKRYLDKSHIHTTSAHESRAVEKLLQPLSVTELPNFVKLDELRPEYTQPAESVFKLLFFSRIEEKKGLDILINALKTIDVPYHLTIAGTGDDAYINHLKTLAADVAGNITWAGFYGDDKFELLQQHHLLVLPSHDENFGNVVVESLSVGTAVLISENVGLAGYVLSENLGWVCQTNTASVSDAINNIAQNQHQQLAQIRQTAPGRVREHFTGTALAIRYIEFYRTILQK
ncbi:XrtY-associated glycosyltransferase XYAG1 [Mucilaginibacter pedocola]|uniref:Glycosyltransferase n=1 Tax=Mucilaginibacter pedocola TaxID=1792845 RepID=A0A1S9PBU9_9SPHI|nr:glycosyltransferase [Mucilaginibacter pedocola]OOQ58088.1 hypothetical protein BC343_10545 [Mucilaginibacter pedocola]